MKTELNSRERVLGLFRRERIDRIPVFSGMGNITLYGLQQNGWHFSETHQDSYKMAIAAASTFHLFGFECAVVPFDITVEAEVLGCSVNYYTDHSDVIYPTISKKLADNIESLHLIVPKNLAQAGRIPIVVDAIRLLKKTIGKDVAVGVSLLGPYTLAGQIIDLSHLTKMTLKEPEVVSNLLETLVGLLILLADIYKKAGADYLTVNEMGAGEDVLSPHIFTILIKPHLERLLSFIKSPKVLHICGETNNIVELMACCGADAISVDQKNRLSESRAKIGKTTLLFGNIDPYNVLAKGKPEDIDEAVKNIIAAGADAVWPGCDIWPAVPPENMKALIKATKKYGRK